MIHTNVGRFLKDTDFLLGGVALPLGLRAEGGSVHIKQRSEGGVVQVFFFLSGVHTRRQAVL